MEILKVIITFVATVMCCLAAYTQDACDYRASSGMWNLVSFMLWTYILFDMSSKKEHVE